MHKWQGLCPEVLSRTKWLSWLLFILCVVSLSATAYLFYEHITLKTRITSQATRYLQQLTHTSATKIDEILRHVVVTAESLADDLSTGKLAKDEEILKQRIVEVLSGNPYFFAMSVTFKPYAYRSEKQLFAPYYYKDRNGKLVYQPIETQYDYSKRDWYIKPMQLGESLWVEPYFERINDTLMTTYSAIFYRQDALSRRKVPAGVVTIDISLDGLKKILESLDLGPSGFSALTSPNGAYLYHPNNDYVVKHKTMLEVAREYKDKDRLWLWKRLQEKGFHKGIIDHVSTTTGVSSWLAYETIKTTGWTLENTFIKSDVPLDVDILRHQLIWITCLSLVFCLSLLFLLISFRERSERTLWLAILLASGLLLAGIGNLWYLALTYEHPRQDMSVAIFDRMTLSELQRDYEARSQQYHTAPPIYVPTGIFVDMIRFADNDDVMMTGYVWQKYKQSVPKELSRAISIPAASDVNITEIDHFQENGHEVIRWRFQARVAQTMSHARYPLDHEILTLQILHKDLNYNVVLVPDIPAYKLTNPTSLPGLVWALSLPGWTFEKTFFDLVENEYSAHFDATQSILRDSFPILRYNIVVRRNFIDAFISNLTPIIVVAFMLFLLLLTTTGNVKLITKMRTEAGFSLSMSSGLFLVVVFSHIGVRQRIQAQEIFYLEYFYFVIYVAILGVEVLSILFAMAKHLSFLQYRNNLVTKLSYWPAILSSLFIITLIVFY